MNTMHFKGKLFFILLLILLSPTKISAATCTATLTGDWTTIGIWSCGHVPTCGDSIVIGAGITVTITSQIDLSACAGPIPLSILGTLKFTNGNKLKLPCGSRVYVYAGGTLEPGSGGGNSNFIEICSDIVWNAATGTVSIASCFPPSDPICGAFLPIELTTFYADINNTAIDLKWSTVSEKNNDVFSLERSSDAIKFEKIGVINSKSVNGNSVTKLDYVYHDQNPLGNVSYYRLKQVDKDKTYSYSNILSINFIKANNIKFVVYPNPNSGEFTVDVSGLENNHPIEITLRDQNGRSVYHSTFNLNDESSLKTKIVPEEKLANGVYICTLRIQEIEYNVKVIVN